MAKLTIKDTANILVAGNKDAFQTSAKRRAGKLLNDRLVAMIAPKMPMMVRASGVLETPIGKAALANVLAGSLIHFGYTNDKLTLAADAMVAAAMDDVLGSFDIEGMINDLIDGVDLGPLTNRAEEASENVKTTLRKAAGA